MPPRTVTGIQVMPGTPTAYSSSAPPQNQVLFSAYPVYSDLSLGTLISDAKWSYDLSYWVKLSGSTATCTQPAPQTAFNIPLTSQITATASISGTTYTADALLVCF
jgi:hypothetical protein